MIRVAIVDDDPDFMEAAQRAVRQSDSLVLSGCASTLQAGLIMLEDDAPDVLVVDLGLPDGSGIDLIQAARFIWRRCEIMVATIFGDEAHVMAAIEAGATGYLLKDASLERFVDEIRDLHAGGSPISPIIARKLLSRFRGAPPAPAEGPGAAQPPGGALSPREKTVLELVTHGYSHSEVAARMGVSHHTVLTFVRRIYLKFGVRTRAEAIWAARRFGLDS